MKYRAEIDGLRALAVVPVILFHAGFEKFSGGFVGVDVFFVISGYLITTLLVEDLENNRFSLVHFYERRARRILPALFCVILVCIPLAWVWMAPSQMKDFAQSLIAVSLFVSNIFFWRESGYFAAAAEEKPLLHTWSLAVEEQYYLLFPLFLFFAWRFGKNRVFWTLIILATISLLVSEWGWRKIPTANFYLAFGRSWELFAGSIAAFIVHKQGVQKNNVLSLLGLAAIIFSIFAYDKNTPFPSVYALMPVLGVVLLVLFAEKETVAARILGTKLFVAIGLMSYSAYLWHQPLFAFARVRLEEPPSSIVMLFLSLLSLVLAYLSWRFIERPFRRTGAQAHRRKGEKAWNRRQIFAFSASMITALVVLGVWGDKSDGFEKIMLAYKYTPEERAEAELVFNAVNFDMDKQMAVKGCHLWARHTKMLERQEIVRCQKKHGKAVVVLGDSHAMNLFNIISFSNSYPFVIGLSQGGCRPHDNKSYCHYDGFEKFVSNNNALIDTIVYHQSGSYFIKDTNGKVDSQKAFAGEFASFAIENISKVKAYLNGLALKYKVKILWVGPFLEYRYEPQEKLFTREIHAVNPLAIDLFKRLEVQIQNTLGVQETFSYRPYNQFFFEPVRSFEANCFMFRDRDHYSRCAEKFIASKLKPRFLDALF